MAYTLAQAAVLAPNPLTKGVIQTFADTPLFDVLPFETIAGNAYSYVRSASLGNADFRALNVGYPESTPDFTTYVAELKRLGQDADVDRYLVVTQNGAQSVEDLRAAAVVAHTRAIRAKFVDTLINGDGTAESFEGVEAWIGAGQEVTGPAGSFGSTADSRQNMFDSLDALIGKVAGGPTVLLMGASTLSSFKSAARREGVLTDADNFGRTIQTYAGIPILDAGVDEDGNPVVATGDIYALRLDAANGIHGITARGIEAYDLGELDTKPTYRTRLEFYCAAVMRHPQAAAVLRATPAV